MEEIFYGLVRWLEMVIGTGKREEEEELENDRVEETKIKKKMRRLKSKKAAEK